MQLFGFYHALPRRDDVTASDEQSADDIPDRDQPESAQDLRKQGAEEMMGPGFLRDIEKLHSKRRAYQFWYHPYTELAIFGLIILSVLLLFIEVAIPTGEPIGWLGGIATGGIVGVFFWADAVITLVFIAEYFSKLWITPKGRKWVFVRNSWIELLAILPVLRVFRLFRIFRAVRVLRLLRVLRSVRLLRTGSMVQRLFDSFGSNLRENQAGNMVVLAYFLSTMAFGTTGVLIFERGTDSSIQTLGDALWWCVVTLSTVGYGDMVPETPGGRMIASVVVMMGLGFWSLVTGVFTSTLVRQSRKKRQMGLDILGVEDHVVIFGWNDNGTRLLRDFRLQHPMKHLVLITEQDDIGLPLHSRHHHIEQNPSTPGILDEARCSEAETIVILAETREDDGLADVEARTMMQCLKARNEAPESRIIVELLDESDISKARSAGADDIVVTDNYAGALISQSIRSPGLHRAYENLFDVGAGSKFGERDFPRDCLGSTFSEAAVWLLEHRNVSLIGIRRDSELQLAPDDEPTIRHDDKAIIIEPIAPKGSLV